MVSNQHAFPQIYGAQNESGTSSLQRQSLLPQTASYPYDPGHPHDLYFNPAIPPGYVEIDPNQNQDFHLPPPSAIRVLSMTEYQ